MVLRMNGKTWPPPTDRAGILHRYSGQLTAFQHTRFDSRSREIENVLLWVGGLSDGLITVGYPTYLAHSLPPTWTLVEVMLRSSYDQFGIASLAQDAEDLEECVTYFSSRKKMNSGKVVIMGHSTGCQDVMEYLTRGRGRTGERPRIDGAILQAPVSDRQALEPEMKPTYDKIIALCRQMVADGKAQDVVPASFASTNWDGTPVTAYRWLSMLSPDKQGDDDFFSSDLSDEQLRNSFGSIANGVSFMILYGGADQYSPDFVDKYALVERWTSIMKAADVKVDDTNGGVVHNMHHNLSQDPEEVVKDMCDRICKFVLAIPT